MAKTEQTKFTGCPLCEGTGWRNTWKRRDIDLCPACEGNGFVPLVAQKEED